MIARSCSACRSSQTRIDLIRGLPKMCEVAPDGIVTITKETIHALLSHANDTNVLEYARVAAILVQLMVSGNDQSFEQRRRRRRRRMRKEEEEE